MSAIELRQMLSGLAYPFGDDAAASLYAVLLTAYGQSDAESLVSVLDTFVAENGAQLAALRAQHSLGAPDFVRSRDWAYASPVYLIIAERSVTAPMRLRAAVRDSDFQRLVEPMIDSVRSAFGCRA